MFGVFGKHVYGIETYKESQRKNCKLKKKGFWSSQSGTNIVRAVIALYAHASIFCCKPLSDVSMGRVKFINRTLALVSRKTVITVSNFFTMKH